MEARTGPIADVAEDDPIVPSRCRHGLAGAQWAYFLNSRLQRAISGPAVASLDDVSGTGNLPEKDPGLLPGLLEGFVVAYRVPAS